MGTITGAPEQATTGVGTGSTVKGISSATWAVGLLEALQAAGYKAPVTPNNIDNVLRVVGAETNGQQGGFLRDNNPWNLNTYASPHASLPGGQIVTMPGANGETVYVQQFDSVEQGIAAYVNQLQNNPALLAAINTNAPASVFGGALSSSAWKSESYANATTFPTLSPANDPASSGTVGGQGLTFSIGKGVGALKNAAKDVATPISDAGAVAGFLGDLTNPTKLKNVGIFAAGLALVGVGLLVFFATTKPGEELGHAAQTGAKVAT